jgi:uncharacterized coiled-coil DUF342 family protein
MEKTDIELFNEAVALKKEANEARDQLDEVERAIVIDKNKIDEIRASIRNKENEIRDWKRVIRTKDCLAVEKERQGWATKRMGP